MCGLEAGGNGSLQVKGKDGMEEENAGGDSWNWGLFQRGGVET